MSETTEEITVNAAYYASLVKISEAVPLLTQSGYFSRYRDNYATTRSCRVAWIRTEGELLENFGMRRFNDFQQFKNALRWERKHLTRRSVRIFESKEQPV